MKRGNVRAYLVLLIAFALSGAGCSERTPGGEPKPGGDLVGTEWTLTSLHGSSLIEDTEITLYFEEAHLGGSMTCNGYGGGPDSGGYSATDDGALTVLEPLAVTVQLCSEPKGVMEQEAAYVEALRSATAYRMTSDNLQIADASGDVTLVFMRRE